MAKPVLLPAMAELGKLQRKTGVPLARSLNASVDRMFYDVGALSPRERESLSAFAGPEGSVLTVHPGAADRPIVTRSPFEFVHGQVESAEEAVPAIVVPGVGSSALGAAAFARNVADCLGRPVAAVVAGFGLSDLLTEALGGWFVLGARNAARDLWARVFDAWNLKDHVRDDRSHAEILEHFKAVGIDSDRFVYGSPDSASLLYLLSRLGPRIELVAGHSKGNLSIENALEGLIASRRRKGTAEKFDPCIVTLGAVVRFPPEFSKVHQYIGSLDTFGMVNSRPLEDRVTIPNATHSLNSAVPNHLSVRVALELAGVIANRSYGLRFRPRPSGSEGS